MNYCRWNAADYAANSSVQQSWARELIAQLRLRGDEHVLDVGCGDGKVTAEIARAVPRGRVLGVDASTEMIAFAQAAFPPAKIGNLKFQICDARKIGDVLFARPQPQQSVVPLQPSPGLRPPSPAPAGEGSGPLSRGENSPEQSRIEPPNRSSRRKEALTSTARNSMSLLTSAATGVRGEGEADGRFDLVFSNAALHWVDDHEAILRGASAVLRPGGRLVISCGGKGNAHDVFLALRPELRRQRWRDFFRKLPAPYFFYSPDDYKKWLPKFGFKINALKLAPKDATYPGADGLATWLRTTWLPYVQRVPENLREEFIAAVTRRYLAKHAPDAEGKVHVRMVRLEIDAVKSDA